MHSSKAPTKNYVMLFSFAYFVSYLTRTNFAAIISEIVSATGIDKTLLSVAVTATFVSYGAGQLISGFLGDRISPKKLVELGLILTAAMNFWIPFCSGYITMTVAWFINGFAQSMLWPPIVKLSTMIFSGNTYERSVSSIISAGLFGTIAVYMFSPAVIYLLSWHYVFLISSLIAIVMLIAWHIFCPDLKPNLRKANATQSKSPTAILFAPTMFAIFMPLVFHGMLRDGITTWMPTYVSENFNIPNIVSIFSGLVLPIFGILFVKFSGFLNRKVFKNCIKCSIFFFVFSAVCALLLALFSRSSAIFSIIMLSMLTACMHGVNFMLICLLPSHFAKFGISSSASGVLNSFVYIGSALSTYGIALISKSFGWNVTALIWMTLSAMGALLLFGVLFKKGADFDD